MATTEPSLRHQAKQQLKKLEHDKLRVLQYLFYDLTAAEIGYRNLLNDWSNDNNGDILNRAVILRNLAECIRKQENLKSEYSQSRLLEALSYIDFESFTYFLFARKLFERFFEGIFIPNKIFITELVERLF